MSNAKALFEAGRLNDAIQDLNQAVKARPADASLRIFLFELLCFQGDLDRAAKQLDVIGSQREDPGFELAVQVYRGLLNAEAARRAVFNGDALPKFIVPPSSHVERYLMLVKKLKSGSAEEIGHLLDQAEEELPQVAGDRSGQPFSSFRDADDRVAGVLEVFHEGAYLWVPVDQIRRLEITPPKKLRELMWVQAKLELDRQPPGHVFIPTRYTDSHLNEDDNVKLGRLTDWTALHDRMVIGQGQRMFLVDGEQIALLDPSVATITVQPAAGAPAA
jgi:type VI secretion system protein ImpE